MSFVKTIIVFFTFLRLSKSCVLQRQSRSSTSLIFQDYQSLLFQDYYSLLYFSKTIRVFFFKTITVFFTFPRLSKSIVLQRLSMSSSFYLFKDHQSILFQRLSESSVETSMSPLLCKTSRSFVDVPDASYTLSFDRFTAWASTNGRSNGEIARTKLVSLSLLPFYFQ